MSYLKPKRIGELSPLDENRLETPLRTSFSESTGVKSFFPKRITELSPLSSDDDEDTRNNAFLGDWENNSIIEPTNSDTEREERRDSASRRLSFEDELESKGPARTEAHAVRSKKSASKDHTNNEPADNPAVLPATRRAILAPQNIREPSKLDRSKCLDVSYTIKPVVPNVDLCTPKVSTRTELAVEPLSEQKTSEIIDETPYKSFQMPNTSMRRLQSSHHRSILSSTGQRKPSRTQIENEFKSQKVLFTTPSVARPAIKMMSNLGLDDTLQCYQASPIVIANQSTHLSPVEEEQQDTEPKPLASSSMAGPQIQANDHVDAATVAVKSVKEPDKMLVKPNDGEKVLNINGKDFVVHKRIGQGGSSTVFLAEHKDTKLECALKVVDLNADQSLVEGYIKEVKILASLQDKKNVIRLYEYALVRSENLLYLVMEKGESDLRKILQGYTNPLPLYTLMNYWHQMLQAVHYIHTKDVIHSDLKPENFLIVRGRLKLIDFGISSKMAVDATSIIKHSQVGTFNYISPESLMDTSTGNSPISKNRQPKIKISPKSDVWSLGCILYLLLYQKTPFAHIKNVYAKIQAVINPDKKIEFAALPNYYPAMLLEMVKLCLIHNPRERASVAALLSFPFEMVIEIEK